ncbi:MAG: hypothetical protein QG653_52 [Patescibacteria group bacterium]|nr:hypothetical protein [Patescibacteria group bacterium]
MGLFDLLFGTCTCESSSESDGEWITCPNCSGSGDSVATLGGEEGNVPDSWTVCTMCDGHGQVSRGRLRNWRRKR